MSASRAREHDCPGDGCLRCERDIDDAEFGDPGADSDWQIGQDRYERGL